MLPPPLCIFSLSFLPLFVIARFAKSKSWQSHSLIPTSLSLYFEFLLLCIRIYLLSLNLSWSCFASVAISSSITSIFVFLIFILAFLLTLFFFLFHQKPKTLNTKYQLQTTNDRFHLYHTISFYIYPYSNV